MINAKWIVLILIYNTGCSKNVKNNIIQAIDQSSCANCTISLADVTDFDWDELFVFPNFTDPEEISIKTGTRYTGSTVPDNYKKMVFLYKKKVVHDEIFQSLDYDGDNIVFSVKNDSSSFILIKKQKSHFMIKPKQVKSCKDCRYFELVQVE